VVVVVVVVVEVVVEVEVGVEVGTRATAGGPGRRRKVATCEGP